MSVGILGAGFGLYGYLPAVILGCRQPVVLPAVYREKFHSRSEMQVLAPHIRWVPTEEELLDGTDTLIVARRPFDQALRAADYASRPGIDRLLLEKPLAPTPEVATKIFTRLRESGKIFRVGYNFGLTEWAAPLADLLKSGRLGESWSIIWLFRAHHYSNDLQNWKRSVSQGGGALRFFGIHVIALLTELGYSDATYSQVETRADDEAETWVARITGNNLPPCDVRVESNAPVTEFHVAADHQSPHRRDVVRQFDPFGLLPRTGELDRRVAILTRVCQNLLFDTVPFFPWQERTLQLWTKLEHIAGN